MDVVSACPLRVASVVWQPGPGAFALTVVVLASYTLAPGTSRLADEQEAPNEADGYWDDDERRSLHVAGDLVPFKPRADVFLVGHAYAPGGEPVPSLGTRLIVGGIDKSIAVYGDRAFNPDGKLESPSWFVRMPLRWERAAGGPYTSNPVGVRADAAPDALGMTNAPNLLPPGTRMAKRGDFIEPIGYGPLAPTWPLRLARLRRHAATWDVRRWNQRPLPSDIDPGYFNVAPQDQQLDELRSNERILLENLHPDHALLVTSLEPLSPRGVIEREGGSTEPLWLRCDTLSIDADRGRCTLSWRGVIALRHPLEAGRVIVRTDDTSGARPASSRRQDDLVGTQTIDEVPAPGAALPFAPSGSPAASPHAQITPPRAVTPTSGLPFRPTSSGPPPLPPFTEADASDGTYQPPTQRPPMDTLPFVPNEEDPYALPVGPVAAASPWAWGSAQAPSPSVSPSVLPSPAAPPPLPAEEPPPPPPLLGPLATPAMLSRSPEPPATASPLPVAPAQAAPAVAGQELPLDAYPLERCAAIAASIARRPAERAAILEAHDLAPERWAALDERWEGAIRRETERGRAKLLRAYDSAYVAQLEAERGPVSVDEYARIMVAAERGAEGSALAALGLPRAARIRLQRVWLRRIADDPAVAIAVRNALEKARAEEEEEEEA